MFRDSVIEMRPSGAHTLQRVVDTAMSRKGVVARQTRMGGPAFCAEYFGLEGVGLFRDAPAVMREEILRDASRNILEESYYIEKSGMAFTARMVNLAESLEEQSYYHVMAGEEAAHFHSVGSFLDQEASDYRSNPFLPLLKDLTENGDRYSVIYAIQVVLEGWGLTHYHDMMQGSQDEQLARAFRQILADEARHHGGGLVILEGLAPNDRQLRETSEFMSQFMQMVQVGPQWLLTILETRLGHLSRAQREKVLEELGAQARTQRMLDSLKRLMNHEESGVIAERLEKRALFRAMSAAEAATL
jgi:hypothetical protein